MSVQGQLATLPLPELLQWLSIGAKTGTLVIHRGQQEHRIVVKRGRVTSTATSDPDHQLGQLLMNQGLIDAETLARAVKLRAAADMPLGRVLVTLEVLTAEDLDRVLREKAALLISDLFHADEARFRFVENGEEEGEGDGMPLELDVTRLVFSAAREIEERVATQGPSIATLQLEEDGPVSPSDSPPREAPAPSVDGSRPLPLRPPSAVPSRPRRALGGLAAAAVLAAALTFTLVVFREGVPAGAEEPSATVVVAAVPPRPSQVAPATLAADGSGVDPFAGVLPPLEVPSAEARRRLPASRKADGSQDLPVAVAEVVENQELREKELREEVELQYRAELEDLRRRLADAERAGAGVEVTDGAAGGESPPSGEPVQDAQEVAPPPPKLLEEVVASVETMDELDGLPEAGARQADGMEPMARAAPAPTAPQLVSRPMPVYPPAALRTGREAEVEVEVLVGEDGFVLEVRPLGERVGLGFDRAARDAAARSVWEPATDGGEPVRRWVSLRFSFRVP